MSSRRTNCLEVAEVSTKSSLRVAVETFSGSFGCFLRTTLSSRSCATADKPQQVVLAVTDDDFFPVLTKAMSSLLGAGASTEHGVRSSLQDVVMVPAVAPVVQSC